MEWQVTTKNPLYSGCTEGVFFQNGQAIVSDELLKDLLVSEYGYSATLIVNVEPLKKGKK